jgi:Short C-terminal domain
MEAVVNGTVDSCLARVDSYFKQEWPHGGSFGRYGDRSGNAFSSGPERIVLTAERRFLYNSWGGLALLVGLSLIIFGAFLVLYLCYWMVVMLLELAELVPMTYTAEIVALPVSSAQTKLRVTASRRDWQHTLESWVQKELVENQAAAEDPAEIEASEESPSTAQSASTDIPEQIKKLAELRDSGALTEDEFERKKAELLDRM